MSWMASLDQTCCQFQDFQGLDAQNSGFVFSHIGHVDDQWLCIGDIFFTVLPQCLSEERTAIFEEIWKNSFGQNENFHTRTKLQTDVIIFVITLTYRCLLCAKHSSMRLHIFPFIKVYNNPEDINLILLRHEKVMWFAHALTAQRWLPGSEPKQSGTSPRTSLLNQPTLPLVEF